MAAHQCLAWAPSLWPLSAHPEVDVYTNAIANDFLSNVVLRSRWIGDPWSETNSVSVCAGESNAVFSRTYGSNVVVYTNRVMLTATIDVVNLYGPFEQIPYTGTVDVTAESLERVSRKMEALLPAYSPDRYTRTDDIGPLSFNDYFRYTGLDSFPAWNKLNLFFFNSNSLGKVIDLQYGELWNTNSDVALIATNGTPYWIKSRNRLNPMGIAQWQYGGNDNSPIWPVLGDYGNFPICENEFYKFTGGSQLPVRSTLLDEYVPILIIHPRGTNVAYTPGEIVYGDPEGGDVTLTHSNGNISEVWGSTIPMPSLMNAFPITNTVAANAMLMGLSTNFPTAMLAYTGAMTTYEGTLIWDNTLQPEQFDAHYHALTNLYLTPWTNWHWTNGQSYVINTNLVLGWETNHWNTNGWFYTNYSVQVGGLGTPAGFWPNPMTNPTWEYWIPTSEFPLYPDPFVWDHTGTNQALNAIPYSSVSAFATGHISEAFSALTFGGNPNTTINLSWGCDFSRDEYPLTISMQGSSVVSSVAITGLYTGTQHRAHLYIKSPNAPEPYGAETWYHRIGIYPLAYTYDATIITDLVDVRRPPPRTLTFQTTNSVTPYHQDLIYDTAWPEPYFNSDDLIDGNPYVSDESKQYSYVWTNGYVVTNVTCVTNYDEYSVWQTNWCAPVVTNILASQTTLTNYLMCGWVMVSDDAPVQNPPPAYSFSGFNQTNIVTTNHVDTSIDQVATNWVEGTNMWWKYTATVIGETNYIGTSNAYDVLPAGWEPWDGHPLEYSTVWPQQGAWYYYDGEYLPMITQYEYRKWFPPYTAQIYVQSTYPANSNMVVGGYVSEKASEVMSVYTNWENVAEFKVLIEWKQ